VLRDVRRQWRVIGSCHDGAGATELVSYMKTSTIAAAAWLALAGMALPAVARAHTHLEKATPADNAVLAEAPQQLSLEFSKVARLTAVTLQREGDAQATKVTPLPKELAAKQTVSLQSLAPGKYLVNWRVVGEDNHVMAGKLHFTIKSKSP